jgi:hypothetical protein
MAYSITVNAIENGAYEVVVAGGSHTTRYEVVVRPEFLSSLGEVVDEAELIRQSFVFLLERESPASILPRFDLEVIGRYFPDYRQVVLHRDG